MKTQLKIIFDFLVSLCLLISLSVFASKGIYTCPASPVGPSSPFSIGSKIPDQDGRRWSINKINSSDLTGQSWVLGIISGNKLTCSNQEVSVGYAVQAMKEHNPRSAAECSIESQNQFNCTCYVWTGNKNEGFKRQVAPCKN